MRARVSIVDLTNMQITTRSCEVVPITRLIDGRGEVTLDKARALTGVAGPDSHDQWYSFSIMPWERVL